LFIKISLVNLNDTIIILLEKKNYQFVVYMRKVLKLSSFSFLPYAFHNFQYINILIIFHFFKY